ncbi:unnamed protein product [Kuraishia capsulata CBS 1993]|uniref:Lipid droplet-associated hydrolase n=1 Tax=Kuraishia capsulata CBS 1993 TaxID=1382522 RepID=W6ML88_9ASCO|nr:uncharacterized protein KUCA_T00003209001 [Kuraishia capsulata CBS 1993]CDK27231.1 unnamed protein product [Kuraishia capsulata CBS 1993]
MVKVETYKSEYPTSYFRLEPLESAGADSESPLLLFLPGNPGLVEYYIDYLQLVQAAFPQLEILCVSHAGFSTTHGEGPKELYPLSKQISHKLEVLRKEAFDGSGSKRQLLVMGHSVGSWILQRVILGVLDDSDLNSSYEVAFAGLITPTITDIAKSSNGRILKGLSERISRLPKLVGHLSFLISCLPSSVLEYLVGLKLGAASSGSLAATCKLVTSPSIVEQALSLASEEMRVIGADQSVNERFFGCKFEKWAYFAAADHWVADETRGLLMELYSENVDTELGAKGGITHSFCVSESKEFAEITISALEKAAVL